MTNHPTTLNAPVSGRANGPVCVAAIQMVAGTSISSNLEEASRLIEMAASRGLSLRRCQSIFS